MAGSDATQEQTLEAQQQLLETRLGPPFSNHGPLASLHMHQIIMRMPNVYPAKKPERIKQLDAMQQHPDFFALAAIYLSEGKNTRLTESFVQSLDDGIRECGGSLPTIPADLVDVLLNKAMMAYLSLRHPEDGFDARIGGDQSRHCNTDHLHLLHTSLGWADRFLENRLTQVPAEDAWLIPQIRAHYQQRVDAFASGLIKHWLTTVPPDFRPDWITPQQRRQMARLQPYLHLLDQHKPKQ